MSFDESMKTKAITEHIPAKNVETKEDWNRAKKDAKNMITWWSIMNGTFEGVYNKGHALHHAQSTEDEPLNFFIVGKEMLQKIKREGKPTLDARNYTFPAKVIYNPEIVTALPTKLVKNEAGRTLAQNNIEYYNEACMSFLHRKEKVVERFAQIKVRYQTVGAFGRIKTHEEWIEGLKAHVFQHEVDHSYGIDIFYGDGDRKEIPIEERYREEGKTKEEMEKEAEELEKNFIENVKNKNDHAIIEDTITGDVYRILLDEELPDGYVEGSLEDYYDEEGNIKEEYKNAPVINSTKVYNGEDK